MGRVTIDAVHPGVIRADLGDPGGTIGVVLRMVKRRWATPADGAKPIAALATATGTGRYFDVDTETSFAAEPALARQLWIQAEKLTGAG
jgi:hypothetical protein